MVQIKQILRLRSQCSLSLNEIARTLHLSKGVVAKYVKLAQLAGLVWDDAKHLDEAALHQKLRSKQPQKAVPITALDDSTNGRPNSVANANDNANAASAKLATNASLTVAQTPAHHASTPPDPTPQSAVPPAAAPTAESPFYPIDFAWLHQELKRKGVTRQLLWEEYCQQCQQPQQQPQQQQQPQTTLPTTIASSASSLSPAPSPAPSPSPSPAPKRPYGYTRFCTAYRAWAKTVKKQLSMRQTHLAGDKMFVDYAGHTMPITNVVTGAVWQAQLFVAVLGASNYTFATATATQTSADWIDAHVRALNFFGGVPILIVPDNARALIAAPDRYEPKVGLAYAEFAAHYGAAILPARPYKPQDKSKVEVAVQITERWILAVLRHRQFFSLDELNAAIAELMMSLNLRPFRKLPGSRHAAYLSLDYPALQLRPLPSQAYEFATFKRVRISLDYHVDIDHHGYSVPYRYANLDVDIRISAHTIECFHGGVRIACHRRVAYGGKLGGGNNALNARTTVAEHMPKAHRAHREWTPLGLTAWAKTIGLSTHQIVTHVLQTKPHPEMGYRACLGLMHLERTYGAVRLEAACRHAVAVQVMGYKNVANILKAGLDRMVAAYAAHAVDKGVQALGAVPSNLQSTPQSIAHDNLRGAAYYH